jgi:hypothetical protein
VDPRQSSDATVDQVAAALFSLHVDLTPSIDHIAKQSVTPSQLSWGSRPEASLAFPALYLLALSRVTQSGLLQLPAHVLEDLESSLRDLLAKRIAAQCTETDATVLSLAIQYVHGGLIHVMNRSIREEAPPSPSWYIAKRVYHHLAGPDAAPDPAVLIQIAALLVTYTEAIRELLVGVQTSLSVRG